MDAHVGPSSGVYIISVRVCCAGHACAGHVPLVSCAQAWGSGAGEGACATTAPTASSAAQTRNILSSPCALIARHS